MAILERIVTVYNDKGSKQALKDLNNLEESFINAGKNIAKAFGAAALAAGALATKLAVDGVQAAIADQKSQMQLAQALKATTGATDAAIRGVEGYIDATQRAVSVSDDELRPSLATLVRATNDVAQAQKLQALALDISAATGRDLQGVSLALAKAANGQFTALTRLGVPLSDNTKEAKDLNAAFNELTDTFGGAASSRAQTFEYRMKGIQIAFTEVLETLGYALLPVLENFAQFVQTELVPQLEQFVNLNKDDIARGLADAAKFAIGATRALGKMFKVISDNLTVFQAFGALLVGTFVGGKVAAGVQMLISALTLLTGTFKKQAAAGTAAGVATAFATGGLSAKAAAAGILAFAAAAGTAFFALNKLNNSFKDTTGSISKQSAVVQNHLADLNAMADKIALITGKTTGGVETKDTQEAINLEAARLNLLREGKIEEAARLQARQAEKEAIKAALAEATRYQDVLQVISDTKITSEEIAVLAAKWGVTVEAVQNYLSKFFAVADGKIEKTELELLAAAWGMTTEQVQKYLDFVQAAKDGKLSPEEINALQEKWGMTVGEIRKYADFVLALQDQKITDKEVKELGSAWGLTNTEVLTYLETIGVPFDYNGKFIDPVNGVKDAWKDTTGAVDAYIASVGDADAALGLLAANAAKNVEDITGSTDSSTKATQGLKDAWKDTTGAVNGYISSVGNADAALGLLATNAVTNAGSVTGAMGAATAAAEGLKAASEVAIGVGEQAQAVAEKAISTSQEAASAGAEAQAIAEQAITTSQQAAAAAEYARASAEAAAAAALAALAEAAAAVAGGATGLIPATNPGLTIDGTLGDIGSGNTGIGVDTGAGGTTVNITVTGSVISEGDLVETVREGVLGGYLSGRVITTDPTKI